MSRPSHLVAGLLAVAVCAAGLVLAGNRLGQVSSSTSDGDLVAVNNRTFVCAGGVRGATAVTGSVAEGRRPSAEIGAEPTVAEMDGDAVVTAYAAQSATGRHWAAWIPCAEPQARWLFVGAGAGVGHDTVVTLHNPREGVAVVDIDVFGPKGPVEAPGLHGITVPSQATTRYDLAAAAPYADDVVVRVIARRGLVAASAADASVPGRTGAAVQEWLPAQDRPRLRTTLVGLPTKPTSATLSVFNAHPDEVVAQLRLVGPDGTFDPTQDGTVRVPPESMVTVPITAMLRQPVAALQVVADDTLAATVRSVAEGDVAFATGAQALRTTAVAAVPGGTGGQLALASTGPAVEIDVTGLAADGSVVMARTVPVPEQHGVVVPLPPKVRTVRLDDAAGGLVGGWVYRRPGEFLGASLGIAITDVKLPVIRPGW